MKEKARFIERQQSKIIWKILMLLFPQDDTVQYQSFANNMS